MPDAAASLPDAETFSASSSRDALGRVLATSAPDDDPEGPYSHEYPYDALGNMVEMPHLSAMIWDHDDQLQEVTAGSETVYFQYGDGNRSRKYTEKSGTTTEERIYLGNFEIYRKRVSGDIDVERESLHVSDGSGRILLIETKTIDEGDAVTTLHFHDDNHIIPTRQNVHCGVRGTRGRKNRTVMAHSEESELWIGSVEVTPTAVSALAQENPHARGAFVKAVISAANRRTARRRMVSALQKNGYMIGSIDYVVPLSAMEWPSSEDPPPEEQHFAELLAEQGVVVESDAVPSIQAFYQKLAARAEADRTVLFGPFFCWIDDDDP